MGNAGSSGDAAEDAALTRVETLRDQLADMERAVRTLSHTPQQIDTLLPHQMRVHGHAVACKSDVRVLLGPVIGKVDCRSARVLLEVDRAATVTCHVLLFDARTNAFVEVPHSSVRLTVATPRRPVVFMAQSLLPGRRYRVVFSGIHRDDALRCTGSFRTPSAAGDLQCAVVSADDVYDLEYGETSLWSELKRAVVDEQSVQLVLHLGGQVAMKRMFDKAWTLLVRHAECAAPPVTASTTTGDTASSASYSQAWALMEDQAMEILRSAYRTQWTMLQDKAQVLANASNLMMWSDWDIYPAFTTSALFFVDHAQPTLEMQVLRAVVRCARRLYQEYQRALWDDDIDHVFAREAELYAIAEQALATTARLHQLSQQQIPAAQNDLEAQKKRRDIDAARKAERHLRALEAEKLTTEKTLVSYNQLLVPQSGEEYVYQVGATAFVLLDMRSARVEPGGSQRAQSEVLSNVQWDFVERILEDESISLLHICTEVPLVDDLPHELRLATEESSEECDFKTWWGSNSHAQQRLLALLFEWKLQKEAREVVLLSGSSNTRFSMKSRVRDLRLRTDIVQWVTGPLSAHSSGRAIPSREGNLFDRYSFEHTDVEAFEKSFLRLEINFASGVSSSSSAKTITASVCRIWRVSAVVVQDPAEVLLGPIIGHVDAISGVVLLEVDRTCDLVCVVMNPLTGEKHRVFQHFEARRPNSFFLNHLRSEHYYEVSFERIKSPDRHRGSFATVAKMPVQFQLIATTHEADEPPPKPQAKSLWPWINENVGSAIPFRGVDKAIHFERDMLDGGEALLLTHLAGELGDDMSRELLMAKIRDRQRLRWTIPGIRQLYCRGSHLILSETVVEDAEHSGTSQLILQDCIEQVHQEYENLLLPPSKRVLHSRERLLKPLQFVFGAFGMFVLPTALTRTNEDDTSLWKCLSEFLRVPGLSSIILIVRKAIVEDSVEDAEEKARFNSSYRYSLAFQREKLHRLLEILSAWYQESPINLSGATPVAAESRSIVILCGHQRRSFDSVIHDVASSSSAIRRPLRIKQFVVGPFQQPQSTQTDLQLNVFPQGTLFGKFAYFHRFQSRVNHATTSDDDRAEGEVTVEAVPPQPSTPDPLSQLFHLQISLKLATDDTKTFELTPTFVVSDAVATTSAPSAALLNDNSIDSLRIIDIGNWDPDRKRWTLGTREPAWLHHVVSQQPNEQEELALGALKTALLGEKMAEIEQSFQRAPSLAAGLVSAENRVTFVSQLHAAIQDFHQHIAGISFRTKYPAIPSAYIINFTLDEFATSDSLAITGAIELDQYRAVLVKSFQNATLFESRLNTFWTPQV